MSEQDLADLFNHYGSDKDINGYASLYSILFHHMKNEAIKMLEIGIGTMIAGAHSSMVGYAQKHYRPGGSLRAWRDFFVNGQIIGCDVQPDTQFSDERIETHLCDSTDYLAVEKTIKPMGLFDIILDDGSHAFADQLATVRNLLPYVKDNGIYIIEDIAPGNIMLLNPEILKNMVHPYPLVFCGVKNNVCVILKHPLNTKTVNF